MMGAGTLGFNILLMLLQVLLERRFFDNISKTPAKSWISLFT
jgi:hypothetical protein